MRQDPWEVLDAILVPEDVSAIREAGLEVVWSVDLRKRPVAIPRASDSVRPLGHDLRGLLAAWQAASAEGTLADRIGISREQLALALGGHPVTGDVWRKIDRLITPREPTSARGRAKEKTRER